LKKLNGVVSKENIIGLELEKQFVEIGYEMFLDRDRLPNNFIIADSLKEEGLPFDDFSFDIIYCGSVFHLLTESQGQRLSLNSFKALKKGGVLFGRTLGSGREVPYVFNDVLTKDTQLLYLHTANSMKKFLENSGFGEVTVTSTVFDKFAISKLADVDKGKVMLLAFTARKQ